MNFEQSAAIVIAVVALKVIDGLSQIIKSVVDKRRGSSETNGIDNHVVRELVRLSINVGDLRGELTTFMMNVRERLAVVERRLDHPEERHSQ